MCNLFMEANGATLPSGFLRDPFGIRSGCCILCLKNMLIDKNKGYFHTINMITEYFLR